MNAQVLFSRSADVARELERHVDSARESLDLALYRFDNSRLAAVVERAAARGVRVRLLLDHNKFEESRTTQKLVAAARFPVRTSYGRRGPGSKMHHKFAILDDTLLITGSYNWTTESQDENFENIILWQEPEHLKLYHLEFDHLWQAARPVPSDAACPQPRVAAGPPSGAD